LELVTLKNLYIHIGTHKTGTSTIQRALREQKSDLNREGIFYISPTDSIKYLINVEKLEQTASNNIRDDISSIIDANNSYQNFVLSWEGLSGSYYGGYYNSEVIAKTLKAALDKMPIKVHIIVYLREQVEFINSLYIQTIHSGRDIPLDVFLDKINFKTSYNWNQLIENYNLFDSIVVKEYKSLSKDGEDNIIQGFGRIINSSTFINSDTDSYTNKSYNLSAFKLAKKVNLSLEEQDKNKLRKLLQSKCVDQKVIVLPQSIQSEIINSYKKENQSLLEDYGIGEMWPQEAVCLSDVEDTPDELQSLAQLIIFLNDRLEGNEKELGFTTEKIKKVDKTTRNLPLSIKKIKTDIANLEKKLDAHSEEVSKIKVNMDTLINQVNQNSKVVENIAKSIESRFTNKLFKRLKRLLNAK
tara:strand:+ start:814 stop:2052 length:1239 start_codon:yes stop_codon:yes gene_type:complete